MDKRSRSCFWRSRSPAKHVPNVLEARNSTGPPCSLCGFTIKKVLATSDNDRVNWKGVHLSYECIKFNFEGCLCAKILNFITVFYFLWYISTS
jgi:hypothetical protein